MLFSVFCGVSLFDILLIITATYYYIKNKRLSKKLEQELCDLEVNENGQVKEKGVDENAW